MTLLNIIKVTFGIFIVSLVLTVSAWAQHIPLDGQPNFRDLGGMKTSDGHRIKQGLLFRSGEINKLSEADIAVIKELKLSKVIDFRSTKEINTRGQNMLPESVNYTHIAIDGEALWTKEFAQFFKGNLKAIPPDLLSQFNQWTVTNASEQFTAFFQELEASSGPLLYHCTHGKDRTGMATVLLLVTLGVPLETAREDYLRSNTYRDEVNKKELAYIRANLAKRMKIDPKDVDISHLKAAYYVSSGDFDAFIDAIKAKSGSVEAYLRNHLKITNEIRDALRFKYLEK